MIIMIAFKWFLNWNQKILTAIAPPHYDDKIGVYTSIYPNFLRYYLR